MTIRGLLVLCLLMPTIAAAQSLALAGWDAGLGLTEPADLNLDPKIVEINLTARPADVEVAPGKRVRAWTYDGGLPRPLIRTRGCWSPSTSVPASGCSTATSSIMPTAG